MDFMVGWFPGRLLALGGDPAMEPTASTFAAGQQLVGGQVDAPALTGDAADPRQILASRGVNRKS